MQTIMKGMLVFFLLSILSSSGCLEEEVPSEEVPSHEYKIVAYGSVDNSYWVTFLYDGIPESTDKDVYSWQGVYYNNTIQTRTPDQIRPSWDTNYHFIYTENKGGGYTLYIFYIPLSKET